MSLRPAPATWFETYVPRDHTVRAAGVLADTGVVQLELDPRVEEMPDKERLAFFLERFETLAAPWQDELPAGADHPAALVGDAAHIANKALHHLRVWIARMEYLREHQDQTREEHDQLVLLAECLEAMRPAGLDLEGALRETRFLCKCLFACPHGQDIDSALENVVERAARGPQHDFLFFVGAPEQRESVKHLVVDAHCVQVGIPAWLEGDHAAQKRALLARLTDKARALADLDHQLRALRKDADMAEARANADTLRWYLQHMGALPGHRGLCHVTGWTTCDCPERLHQALRNAGIDALVRFPEPPRQAAAPVALLDSWWSRPFQPLLKMWGTPAGAEVDPSGLLAVVVPLLFGYMFPDVGHGLTLALLAWLLGRLWPEVRPLLPCGLSAMVFGLLFGDVFGFDTLIPPLWLKPLDNPILVLVTPMVFGAGLLLLGMALSGATASWRGEMPDWLWREGSLALLYLAVLLSLIWPPAGWLALPAVAACFLGTALRQGAAALPAAAGELLLSAFELAMNTLSFARVGAFALGHAALSHATLTLAAGVEHPLAWGLVILLGNLVSLVLEGLVVYVQTTRLVLFEFFTRFLKEEGRPFRPARRQG